MTITIKQELDFNDLQSLCWSNALDTLDTIAEHDKEDDLMYLLEETITEDTTIIEINDILCFDSEWVLEQLGINEEEDD